MGKLYIKRKVKVGKDKPHIERMIYPFSRSQVWLCRQLNKHWASGITPKDAYNDFIERNRNAT